MNEVVELQGKVWWVHCDEPDKYGKYSAILYPTPSSQDKFMALGTMNQLKKDERGYFVRFGCVPSKEIKGKMVTFPQPYVRNSSGNSVSDREIENGTDATVLLERYPFKDPQTGRQKYAVRLKGIELET